MIRSFPLAVCLAVLAMLCVDSPAQAQKGEVRRVSKALRICADGEVLVKDSTAPSGVKCATVASGGGGTPGGDPTSVQFNDSGAFGGFGSWDGTTLTIPSTGIYQEVVGLGGTSTGGVPGPGIEVGNGIGIGLQMSLPSLTGPIDGSFALSAIDATGLRSTQWVGYSNFGGGVSQQMQNVTEEGIYNVSFDDELASGGVGTAFYAGGNTAVMLGRAAMPWSLLYAHGAVLSVLGTAAQPTVSTQGTTGATTYSYKIVAKTSQGHSPASTARTITTGNATLSGSNFNRVSWSRVQGATFYDVYRTAGGATQGIIAADVDPFDINSFTYTLDDTGLAGGGESAPVTNTTGIVFPAGYKAADGSDGVTVTTCTAFKNGLCVSGS